ncbi:MAG: PIG-L family deacetylase [Anaerolineaceae bacterium]|nr:PIG-L family deacetylase [Anaerolineaceae bacterium]
MESLPAISQQRILAVYAHPDDECYCSGGTLAKYSAAGAETMVISATKGQAGQINDTRVATRYTLGYIREQELQQSCESLGVKHIECWDYMDGALNQADRRQLVDDIVEVMHQYRPHVVITFGLDGAYGHPDHIAIAEATTQAFYETMNGSASPHPESHSATRLYYAYFPERRLLLLDHLAKWLVSQENRFHGTLDFVHGLSLFAEESTMLNYANDFVNVRWYPPGFCIIEQGEAANDLFVILSGTVDVKFEEKDGSLTDLNVLHVGDFFGEMGIANRHTRQAHVIAKSAVTCLVLSPGKPANFAGRGDGAVLGSAYQGQATADNVGLATHAIDVREYIRQKISAISQHRTQYPITPDMFPETMLQDLFGQEYYVQIYPPRELKPFL